MLSWDSQRLKKEVVSCQLSVVRVGESSLCQPIGETLRSQVLRNLALEASMVLGRNRLTTDNRQLDNFLAA